jgi:hypothetical protein
MWSISEKNCGYNPNTHFTFNNIFSRNLVLYGIMWKIMVEAEGPQMTI